MQDQIHHSSISTSLGHIRAQATSQGLYRLVWQQDSFTNSDHPNEISTQCISELKEYLSGSRSYFTLPLDLSFYSIALQKWLKLIDKIPYGEVRSYRQLAESWGNSKASRAAGQACKRNPIPIIIPCHRVIQSAGGKMSYSGGDETHARDPANLNRKQRLLDLEQGRDWLFNYE